MGAARPSRFAGEGLVTRPSRPDQFAERALLDAAPDALICVDEAGTVTLVNRQTTALFGYSRDEILGQPVELLIPERFHDVHRRRRAEYVTDPRTRAMGAGLELFGRRKDGSEFPAEVSLASLDTEAGRLVTAAVRDIGDRKRENAMFRALLESAPDAMVIVDSDGRITLVNEQTERLFGFPRDELIGQWVELLVPEPLRQRHVANRKTFSSDPRLRAMGSGLELYGRRKDGTQIPIEISLSPLETEDGTLVSTAIRDVTERRDAERAMSRAREAAELANRELEAFSYSVAHDLRSPLRGIDGFSHALLANNFDQLDAAGRESLAEIRASTRRMAELIDGLLHLARVTQSELVKVTVDLTALAEAHLARLCGMHPDRRVERRVQPGMVAKADERLLDALLRNLLENAWKFTAKRDPARIEVDSVLEGDSRVYRVRDDGAGFDMAYGAKLFGVFQRLHAHDEFEGIGIGLATASRIVQRHGGRIWAEGEVDGGATFYFTLG